MTGRDLIGGLIFTAVVIAAAAVARWLGHAVVDYEPHCVYRIPLMDGRVYIGHGRDKDARLRSHRRYQQTLPDGHPRKWWDQVPTGVRASMVMPEEWVTWYRSKAIAEQMERAEIRAAEASGTVVLANRIKYKGVDVSVGDHD